MDATGSSETSDTYLPSYTMSKNVILFTALKTLDLGGQTAALRYMEKCGRRQ
jgi:hypothetical protein